MRMGIAATLFGPYPPVSQNGRRHTKPFVRRNITLPLYAAVRNCSRSYLTHLCNEVFDLGRDDLAEASAIENPKVPHPFLQPVQSTLGRQAA